MVYDGDVESAGTPAAVVELRQAVAAADVVVFVTPEYNGTIPGMLGNSIDWLSRPAGQSVLEGKTVLVLSASPTRFGGARAAQHLREVLSRIGADVLRAGISVPLAHQRLAATDVDPDLVAELTTLLSDTLDVLVAPAPRPDPLGALEFGAELPAA